MERSVAAGAGEQPEQRGEQTPTDASGCNASASLPVCRAERWGVLPVMSAS